MRQANGPAVVPVVNMARPMPDRTRGVRVFVALDVSPRSFAALATAGALAAELDAELAGLFVEDINLQRLLALPFARELCVLSGALRPLSQQEIEQTWRREAEALRRRLAEAAARLHVRWTFQVARGRMATEVDTRIGACDVLVLGQRTTAGMHATGRLSPPARIGPVLVLLDPGAAMPGLLDLGARLARRSGVELLLLIRAVDEAAYRAACAAMQAVLKERDVGARCASFLGDEIEGLARATRREMASCVVLSDCGGFLRQRRLEQVLNTIECPVVLGR